MSFLRKNTTLLAFSAVSALALAIGCSRAEDSSESASSDFTSGQSLVISQVYGGGGNTNAPLGYDYVELFNATDADVELAGKSIQYAAAAGNFTAAKNVLTLPPTTAKLAAGHYFLIQLSTGANLDGGAAPPAPLDHADYVATTASELLAMAATSGKVALVDTVLDGCGAAATPCDAAKLIDLVGYGTATQFRGAPTAPLSASLAAIRRAGGCATDGNNSTDFEAKTPAPRNGLTPASPLCSGVDAAAPPPPPVSDASTDGATTDGGTPPKPDGGAHVKDASAPKPLKDAGSKGTTAGDDDDDDNGPTAPADGGGSKVSTHPTSGATNGGPNNAVTTPAFPATTPDCTMTSGPMGSHTGLAAIFGLVLAAAAARRKRR